MIERYRHGRRNEAWQKGYQLDYLKEITKEYDDYNKYTDSPFAQFKKNNVADFLDKGLYEKQVMLGLILQKRKFVLRLQCMVKVYYRL